MIKNWVRLKYNLIQSKEIQTIITSGQNLLLSWESNENKLEHDWEVEEVAGVAGREEVELAPGRLLARLGPHPTLLQAVIYQEKTQPLQDNYHACCC